MLGPLPMSLSFLELMVLQQKQVVVQMVQGISYENGMQACNTQIFSV